MSMNNKDQYGHIDNGIILPIVYVLGLLGYLEYTAYARGMDQGALSIWLAWSWWKEVLSILGFIVAVLIGNYISEITRWPR
jgi:hypothetical protein